VIGVPWIGTPIGVGRGLCHSSDCARRHCAGGQRSILIIGRRSFFPSFFARQRMSKREELLGTQCGTSHTSPKAVSHVICKGHATVGLLFGHTAAGRFIATAARRRDFGWRSPVRQPEVMDLPRMADE